MLKQTEDLERGIRFAHIVAEEHKAARLQVEHVLLGFLLDATGPATTVIEQAGIKRKELWDMVAADLVDGKEPSPQTLTKDGHLTYLLERARRKAQNAGNPAIHSLHLLAIMVEDNSFGKPLRELGLSTDMVEAELQKLPREKIQPKAKELSYKARRRKSEIQIIQNRFKNAKLLRQISPVFLVILGVTIGSAVLLGLNLIPASLGVFLFVLSGWVASVCLHEYGHALVAYLLGDDTITEKGYLTLNPVLYAHGFLSVILPIIFLLMGGIGLPGGAVYVDRNRLRDFKYGSAVSAAGPAMTLFSLLLCCIPLWIFYPINGMSFDISPVWAAVGMLAMLELTALFFNLIPIPGLDGYGIIAPWLPAHVQMAIAPIGRFGFFLIYILFFMIPGMSNVFWSTMFTMSTLIGVDPMLFYVGFSLFRFWAN